MSMLLCFGTCMEVRIQVAGVSLLLPHDLWVQTQVFRLAASVFTPPQPPHCSDHVFLRTEQRLQFVPVISHAAVATYLT